MQKLKNFMTSWSKGIAKGIPYQLKSLTGSGLYYTAIELKENDFLLSQFHEGNFIKSRRVARDEAIKVLVHYQGEQVIVIPNEHSITFNLSLPKTALRSLEQLIESEIQRQTPFDASEVNLSYEIISIDKGEVSIAAQVVPKLKLNELLDKAKGFGLKPTIAIGDRARMSEAENLNLLQRIEPHAASGSFSNAVSIALLILIIAAVISPFVQRHISTERAEFLNQSLKNQITSIQLTQRELTHLKKDAQIIRKFAQERHEAIDLLESVSKAVPDSAWLSRYSTSNNTITLHGFAENASEVLTELAKIKTLSAPTLQSPIIKDGSKNLERFHIRAKIL